MPEELSEPNDKFLGDGLLQTGDVEILEEVVAIAAVLGLEVEIVQHGRKGSDLA